MGRSKGNFMKATYAALKSSYSYLTPDLWKPTHFVKPPFQEWSDYLSQSKPIAYTVLELSYCRGPLQECRLHVACAFCSAAAYQYRGFWLSCRTYATQHLCAAL